MIRIEQVSKRFQNTEALKDLSFKIKENEIFGLVGTNGSGKTTLLKMISGIYQGDTGFVTVDEEKIYENADMKGKVFYIADDSYFPLSSTCDQMKEYYKLFYPKFDESKYTKLLMQFNLKGNVKIHNLSKGMKKQISIILGVSSNAKYLLMDETFDGLDPVMRQAVKSLLVSEVCNREITPIIASHNLRELEDICDSVGLLHNGTVLIADEMDNIKENLHKVQCVFEEEQPEMFQELDVRQCKKQGSLYILTIKGDREDILATIESRQPIFCEMIPLSLEEMFISETEVAGYEIKNRLY